MLAGAQNYKKTFQNNVLAVVFGLAILIAGTSGAYAQIFESPSRTGQGGSASDARRSVGGLFRDTFGGTTTIQATGQASEVISQSSPSAEQLPEGARPIVQDGDLSFPAEPEPVQDGVLGTPERQPIQDGVDSLRYDTRPPADYLPFESPPAGYDPDQFTIPSIGDQISSVDPTRTRSGARLFDTEPLFDVEPYAPIGISVGSFLLFPEVELAGRYFSNVFSSPTALEDVAIDVLPSARLASNWSRHALELRAAGNLTAFSDFSDENELGYALETRGRLDITSRSNVEVGLGRSLSQETRNAINAPGALSDRTDILDDQITITGNHRFNRLSLRLTTQFGEQDFGSTGQGADFVSNDDRDIQTGDQTLRATWEFKPTFSAFAEAGVNQRHYEVASLSDGIRRDSDGERYRVGVDFGGTGALLRGSFSLGYGVQSPDAAQLNDVDGLLIDADLEWRATSLTSVLFTANSDIFESTTAGSAAVISRTVGLGVRHVFREQLIATAGIVYSHRDFSGAPLQEHEIITSLGLEYFLRRGVSVFLDYDHTNFLSDSPDSDYTADELRFGLRLNR